MKIVVSIGDINGIGFECFIKSLPKFKLHDLDIILFANSKLITKYLDLLNFTYILTKDALIVSNHSIKIFNIESNAKIKFGEINKDSGIHAIKSLDESINFIKNNKDSVLLTLPISKKAMHLAGWDYPGHTEYIAAQFEINFPLMILFNTVMKVALATIHIPISQVAITLKAANLENTIITFAESLKKDFGIDNPKIAVLGLNPHAGENNSIGIEESLIIAPVIEKLNNKHKSEFNIEGPFPADGFFAMHNYKIYDGVIAMYHDQGLIPLKMQDYINGVNYTAGLPIIRVSPDHGTAFNIAGIGVANYHSTFAAIMAGYNLFLTRNNL